MSKVTKKYTISAKGILDINDEGVVSIENEETGELVSLSHLLVDFANKDVALSITYNEDYE